MSIHKQEIKTLKTQGNTGINVISTLESPFDLDKLDCSLREIYGKTISNYESVDEFFKKYGLDLDRKYICFSGDDKTTSPLDQYYLEDLAKAVRNLNSAGQQLGIIYRKCPFDISNRYDVILEKYSDIIKVLNPYWKQINNEGDMLSIHEDYQMLSGILVGIRFLLVLISFCARRKK